MGLSWKANWSEAETHYRQWWKRDGLVLSAWGGFAAETPHEQVAHPGEAATPTGFYEAPEFRARLMHYHLSRRYFPGDILPIADTMIGPGSLALLLGAEPGYSPQTVWFKPSMMEDAEPERRPPFVFDEANRYFQIHRDTCQSCVDLGAGKYLTGCPDLVENLDILSALRDPQVLMMDMVERPGWIEEKMWEINQVWFETYSRIHEVISLEDGSSAFACFGIWGPGKTAKVQCDAAAMFSPAMFKRFVVPALSEQCEWLDASLFHLDGTQCICHLDHLLEIEPLDAIEWTPQAGIENGGSPRWYEMYKRILAAGKSVQAIGVAPDEVIPLLDAVGAKGMYICCSVSDAETYERLYDQVASYR